MWQDAHKNVKAIVLPSPQKFIKIDLKAILMSHDLQGETNIVLYLEWIFLRLF